VTLHKPWIMQPTGVDPDLTYTAQEIRVCLAAAAAKWWDGPVGAGDFAVTQRAGGATFSVDVAAGVCQTTGDDGANQGPYWTWNDATVNVATPSAPVSGTRVHRLVLQVRDKLFNGTYTTYDAVLSVLPDTGSGTPAEPNSATTLALISISSTDTSVLTANIADWRVTGRTLWAATALPVSTNTDALVPGISKIPVMARTYRVRGSIMFQNGSVAGTHTANLKFQGPAVSAMLIRSDYTQEGTGGSVNPAHNTALNSSIGSPNYAASQFYFAELSGTITFSAPGLAGLTLNSGSSVLINLLAGSVLDLVPVL
jgi:hypothetical protein